MQKMSTAYTKNTPRIKKTKPTGADGHRRRMLDRFISAEGIGLTDRDLVEMLLFYTYRIRDTRDIAVDLMDTFDNSIESLLTADTEELEQIDGVGSVSASFLTLIGELSSRLKEGSPLFDKQYTDTSEIGALFSKKHMCQKQTDIRVAFFDSDMHLITIEKIKDGSLGPEDTICIFSIAALASAYRSNTVAIARFSDDFTCYPTKDDFTALRHIRRVFKSAEITLREYFIVSPDESLGITDMCF